MAWSFDDRSLPGYLSKASAANRSLIANQQKPARICFVAVPSHHISHREQFFSCAANFCASRQRSRQRRFLFSAADICLRTS